MLSLTEENYLKIIYNETLHNERVGTTRLAKLMNSKPASVTEMLQKISDKGLIGYIPYRGAKLTKSGITLALKIIRRHRLWELFLVKTLGFEWDEVHEIAEQLEHIQSEKLIKKLYNFLGKPKFDPHGDPIPNSKGNYSKQKGKTLDYFSIGQKLKISRVLTNNPYILKKLKNCGLTTNTVFSVIKTNAKTGNFLIKTENQKKYWLQPELANQLLIHEL